GHEDRRAGVEDDHGPHPRRRPPVLEAGRQPVHALGRGPPARRAGAVRGPDGEDRDREGRPRCRLREHGERARRAACGEAHPLLDQPARGQGEAGGGEAMSPAKEERVSLYEFMPYGAPELMEVAKRYMYRATWIGIGAIVGVFLLMFV